MAHPQRERIAAVLGENGQGSGYLLSPWLVLTAAHVVGGAATAVVVVPGGHGRVECRVAWRRYEEDCDVAILVTERYLVPAEVARTFATVRWGTVEDLAPRPGAHAVGYPHAQRDGQGELDSEQLVGTLKPASGLLRGRQVLDSLHGAPAATGDHGSPWAGFSGAAVFVDDHLVGVVRSDPTRWQHGRVEITPTTAIVRSPGIHKAFHENQLDLVWVVLDPPEQEQEFEERLRSYIAQQSGSIHIIGMSRGSSDEDHWLLDSNYLSLELVGGRARHFPLPDTEAAGATEPQRAEQALSGQRRVLIRGAAGSGKTTLMQWLATVTARRELPPPLAELRDCVPLLLRLRTLVRLGELPAPEDFLAAVAKPLTGLPGAAGWVTEQLRRGRLLLLVDGVDEVPEADRPRVRDWLLELLAAYPDARYVVTTRPSAVREGWLSQAGFTELELLPMSRADVATFITTWHLAADAGPDDDGNDDDRSERINGWRDALLAAVVAKPDLGRLATTPLMCALICALNRDRNGYLPEGRMELYAAALEMLLVRRDRERGIAVREGLRLSAEQQLTLLQKLAYWLVTNGATEIERPLAVRKLDDALPSMSAVNGDGEEVLRHLLVRSGLLRQPTVESVDFIHRTFQDFLAAKAAVEEEDLGVLVGHAHDDQWADVLRMSVGHARPGERAKLLRALLRRAEADPAHGDRLRLLAATCLEHATELDPEVRLAVETSVARLVPPHSEEAAKALATVGEIVLDLLPGPGRLDEDTALAVVIAATTIAGERAIPLLARYADHPSAKLRGRLAFVWDRFDTRTYGERVISRLTVDGELRFYVKNREQAAFLAGIGGRPRVESSGPLTDEDLRLLPLGPLVEFRLHENPYPIDLSFLAGAPGLTELLLINCEADLDLRPLTDLPLHSLTLSGALGSSDLTPVGRITSLRKLSLGRSGAVGPITPPPGIDFLSLTQDSAVSGLERCTELDILLIGERPHPTHVWRRLSAVPALGQLIIYEASLADLDPAYPLLQLYFLTLVGVSDLDQLWRLPLVCPNLRVLSMVADPASVDPAHLAPLHGCQVIFVPPSVIEAAPKPA
ncbi:serine protease [Streptacidiphilus albus]|uniref:serine protease n=1 Tax=Streptacidiphilus albus TaxID=105425 RepID=UPI00068BE11C|nr:serine protease [Streptacidiphilus albus]